MFPSIGIDHRHWVEKAIVLHEPLSYVRCRDTDPDIHPKGFGRHDKNMVGRDTGTAPGHSHDGGRRKSRDE